MKQVVVIGAGFGGLNAARILGSNSSFKVNVIDRRNYHLFQPLLYQVAMAGLNPSEIAVPIRSILSKHKNIDCVLGNVDSIDPEARTVTGDFGALPYDYLVVAAGARHSYFGKSDWENFAPGLKTIEQATEIRSRVLLAYERAELTSDPDLKKAFMTFAVIGGGPTGVELAGALGEISRNTLKRDFRHINPRSSRVVLIEAGERILPSFAPDLSASATRDLETLGVSVWTNTRVTNVTAHEVSMGEERLKARTVIWAAGVKPSHLNESLPGEKDPSGKLFVSNTLNLSSFKEVFVIGDQARVLDAAGKLMPGLASVAIQQGIHAARNIIRMEKNQALAPFRYVDKGQMATIGRSKAVAELGGLRFTGFVAWIAWLFVHIYFLIGFRNRLFVFIQWMWGYFTYTRSVRLIVGKDWKTEKKSN